MKRLPFVLLVLSACSSDDGPRLTKVDPASAPLNGIVTLTGSGLCGSGGDCAHAGGQVEIGLSGPVQAAIEQYSDTSIEIVIPPIAPVGKTQLYLTVGGQTSNALDFEVTQ